MVCLREKSRKGRDAFPLSVLHLCTCGAYATTKGGEGGGAVRSCSLEV